MDVDVFVQPEESRFKRLLVADMDSTIVGQECLDELADFAGLKREIAEITERAMQGKLDFKAALRERVALLSGLDEEAIGRCLAERVVPNPGAATLVRTMRVGGARAILVTGGFVSFADPDREDARASTPFAQTGCCSMGGQLSGSVEDPIVDAQAKLDALVEAREEMGSRTRRRARHRRRRQRQADGSGSRPRCRPIAPSLPLPKSRMRGSTITGLTPCFGRRAFAAATGLS